LQKRPGTVARIASPVRALAHRFHLPLLVIATLGTIALGQLDLAVVERARLMVLDSAAPVLEAVSEPLYALEHATESFRELAELRQINESLKRENERLMVWHHRARRLEAENLRLRALLNLAPEPEARYVSARVIGDSGGAFARSLLVAAGSADGIVEGQAALSGEGLAGRVVDVSERAARVMLITDLNSQIPVSIGLTGERAIRAGDNSTEPRLLYLQPGHHVAVGDRVIPSGHGGLLPPGLPVGVVSHVSEEAVRVRPYVEWRNLEFLRLVDYELPGLIGPLVEKQRPTGG